MVSVRFANGKFAEYMLPAGDPDGIGRGAGFWSKRTVKPKPTLSRFQTVVVRAACR